MSRTLGRSVPLNQTHKLPGGATITRAEVANILVDKGINVGQGFMLQRNMSASCNPFVPDKCDEFCGIHCGDKSCTSHNPALFDGLYNEEVIALLRAEVISFSSLNVAQLQAIRPFALEALQINSSLAGKLSAEQLKAIKG